MAGESAVPLVLNARKAGVSGGRTLSQALYAFSWTSSEMAKSSKGILRSNLRLSGRLRPSAHEIKG